MMQYHCVEIVIYLGNRFSFVCLCCGNIVYICLYLIGIDILYITGCLIKWVCQKYCLHKISNGSILSVTVMSCVKMAEWIELVLA